MADRELLLERLERLAIVLDELMPQCAELVRDAISLLKEQEDLGTELTNAVELIHKKNERIEKLLKEQEAVEPIPFFTETGAESPNYVICGHCKSIKAIMPKATKQKYCHECGFPVLWEGR